MSEEVWFTLEEFAFLARRTPKHIGQLLRDGLLEGKQRGYRSSWMISERELAKFWGSLYSLGEDKNGE